MGMAPCLYACDLKHISFCNQQQHVSDYESSKTQVSDCMIAGVREKMVGMKVGESRQIQLTLPDDFEPAPLRGVDVTCTVGVTELFEYDLPEVMLHCMLHLFDVIMLV